ncbi:ABC transporter ABCC2 [Capsaspora owczarzaki ATCC 30864]|uniref:ABC transporter ABCC2 n=1 Tax=Capsaspora owczarzaki (strain ATCC 30864) TaxID=595528 RepID=A0A0D2URP3_CAPO3|nr:ABC transporter ABCC2 [Capsaspora owczarzaki ATCC 30864]KJE97611.1 ABC transporter ABCC2 [Capsaspora owczarzaki ATCC 30864]|eukprot:XP_004343298.1 ABC transporter ABCC2 [Capsaspora owczarzaki ATCC 30864]
MSASPEKPSASPTDSVTIELGSSDQPAPATVPAPASASTSAAAPTTQRELKASRKKLEWTPSADNRAHRARHSHQSRSNSTTPSTLSTDEDDSTSDEDGSTDTDGSASLSSESGSVSKAVNQNADNEESDQDDIVDSNTEDLRMARATPRNKRKPRRKSADQTAGDLEAAGVESDSGNEGDNDSNSRFAPSSTQNSNMQLTSTVGSSPSLAHVAGATHQPARKPKVGTYETASALSKFCFVWLDSVLRRARQKKLAESELNVPATEEAELCFHEFERHWQAELEQAGWSAFSGNCEKLAPQANGAPHGGSGSAAAGTKTVPPRQPSVLRALLKAFWRDFLWSAFFKLMWGALMVLTASYFVIEIVAFVADPTLPSYRGWILACFYGFCCFLLSAALQQMTSLASRVGLRVRGAMMTAVYRKALTVEGVASEISNVVTLVSSDCSRLNDGCTNFHYLWSGPIEALCIVCIVFTQTGVSAVVGLLIALLIVPLQYVIALRVAQIRRNNIAATDVRVQVMNEILQAIKLVKFYAWERSFARAVERLRADELKYLRQGSYFKTVHLVIVFFIPVILTLCIFSIFIFWQDQYLDAVIAFTVLSLFNSLRFPLVVLPVAIKNFSDSSSSLKRISTFLLLPEMAPRVRLSTPGIRIEDATFSYTAAAKPANSHTNLPSLVDNAPQARTFIPGLSGINIDLHGPTLLAVVGSVSSGKTSLINGLVGDAVITAGTAKVGGTLAYVPQTSWIQHASVRDNILFGRPMDEARYRRTVFACALESDFKILQFGDMTEIGESGINLSGGQKQRISLARAVYSNSDVYLLDSPLSAVDHHTCTHIFEHCIKGMLRDKTVVLVTHQLHLLPQCDLILACKEGQVAYYGPFDPIAVRGAFPGIADEVPDLPAGLHGVPSKIALWRQRPAAPFDTLPMSPVEVISTVRPDSLEETVMTEGKEGGSKARKSERRSKWYKSYVEWFRQGTRFGFVMAVLIAAGAQVIRTLADLSVREWAQNGTNPDQMHYLSIYLAYISAFLVALFIRGLVYFAVTLRAATRLHNKMFRAVLRAPLAFFTVTPLGPLLNCFSRLQDQVDETLPDSLHMGLIYFMILMTTVGVLIALIPWFALVSVALLVAFIVLQHLYGQASKFMKTLVAVSTPPVYAHVSESLAGISVVRAYEAQPRFINHNIRLINRNHVALFNTEQIQCWVAFRLDSVASLMVLATALFCVGLRDDLKASAAGLAISSALQMLVFLNKFVRSVTEVRSQISAIETISHYIRNTTPELDTPAPIARLTAANEDTHGRGQRHERKKQRREQRRQRREQLSLQKQNEQVPMEDNRLRREIELNEVTITSTTSATTGRPKVHVARALPPRRNWPPAGGIAFTDVNMRYFPTSDLVLRGVTFTVQPREKIGIVGRTGSGKSTLLMALFRLVEMEAGSILIDGTDVTKLGLEELRGSLAIIPQEPVMFHGSIRSNLDPFNEFTDAELWLALELSHLRRTVERMPKQLDTPVAANGTDLSLGQKQLFCLTRAILRNSSVLVLDEATSALDLETDSLIQKTLRGVFADCTVLTIAHRLETIMDYDKVLFLDRGKVIEFGPVKQLKEDKNSHFYSLLHADDDHSDEPAKKASSSSAAAASSAAASDDHGTRV